MEIIFQPWKVSLNVTKATQVHALDVGFDSSSRFIGCGGP